MVTKSKNWASYTSIRQHRCSIKNGSKRGKRSLYMIKGSIQQETITALNIYAPNIRATIYTKQKLIELKEK